MPYYYHEVNHSKKAHSVYVKKYTNEMSNEMISGIWYKEQELLYVEKGTLELFVDSKSIILNEGEIACVNTGRMHFANSVGNDECVVYSYLIDLTHIVTESRETDTEHIIGLRSGILNFPERIDESYKYYRQVKRILADIRDVYAKENTSYELKLKSLLLEMFYYFDQTPYFFIHEQEWDRAKSKEKRDRIFAVFDFLEKNYMRQITIEDMANHIYIGKDAFYKFFKSMTGISPVDYLIDMRITKAKEMLATTDIPVLNICYDVGFLNESYFIRQFKKRCGITPKQFRLMIRKDV